MSSTERQKTRFRLRLGGDDTSMPDDYIDGLFDDALILYPDGSDMLLFTAALLEGARDLQAAAMSEVDYTANTASEKLSQRYTNLSALVAKLEAELDGLVNPVGVAVGMAGLRKIPPTLRRYPRDYR